MSGIESFNTNPELVNSNSEFDSRVSENKADTMKSEKEIRSQQSDDGRLGRVGESFKDEDGNKHYLDDNGKEYRVNDTLISDNEFTRNGYDYKTDSEGRTSSVEGKLQLKDHSGRYDMDSRATVMKDDGKKTDDRGHLIADLFNGSGGLENVVAMDENLNQHGDYKKMENTLVSALNDGCEVYLKVEPVYSTNSNSVRPTEFRVMYTINGEKTVAVLKNGEK